MLYRSAIPMLCLGIAIAGCSAPGDAERMGQVPSATVSSPPSGNKDEEVNAKAGAKLASFTKPTQMANRMVIRSATLDVRVRNIDEAEKKVNAEVRQVGGYLENVSSTDLAGNDASLSIRAKVPVNTFDDVIANLEGLGTRMAKTVSMEDITDPVIDLDARLKSLKAAEEGTRKRVSNGADSRDLIEIRSQIESLQALRDAHAKQAAFSTVELKLTQGAVPGAYHDPNWMGQAYGSASSTAGEAFRVVATIFLWLVFMSPFYVPFVAAAWLVYRARRRRLVTGGRPSVGALRAEA